MEADEFKRGDELAIAGDRAALEYGWWADGWIEKESKESEADPTSRAAFSYALTVLEKRHGKYLSKTQITDRIRIGRAFPEPDYQDLQAEFPKYHLTFSVLRAVYVRDDPEETMRILLEAATKDMTPIQIYAFKMGCEVETDEARAWRHLVDWAYKYVERCGGAATGRCKAAKMVIDTDREERNAG